MMRAMALPANRAAFEAATITGGSPSSARRHPTDPLRPAAVVGSRSDSFKAG